MSRLLDVFVYAVCILGGVLAGVAFIVAWSLLPGPLWVGACLVTVVVGALRARRRVAA